MADLDIVPEVEIDPEGKFKYILLCVRGGSGSSKLVVRGTGRAEFHPDILAAVEPDLMAAGLHCEVRGGGKILHQNNSIKVFSKSTGGTIIHIVHSSNYCHHFAGFGKADHSKTVEILKNHFPEYEQIEWTDED